MTDAPIAQTIHDGNGIPPEWRRQMIVEWLKANGIDHARVAVNEPVLVLSLPHLPTEEDGPWLIQVILFTEHYVNPAGAKEQNLLTRRIVSFQRTVPLQHAFPTDPTTDGEDHGEADRQAAEEAPQDGVRDQEQAGVPHPRQGARQGGPVQGPAARNEGAAEGCSSSRHEALPQPEEVGRQEEVEGER
ncbi:hypothetical protein [Streptomyces chartreusis]|uniref:hypothetical protein n=1 Tax=Streptomyces chartreusis TaxID=1969 RepID=UPI003660A3AC